MKEKHSKLTIITEHASGLIAIEKPTGILSHPNNGKIDKDALFSSPYDSETETYMTKDGPIYLLHRLDSPTSGVLLLTKKTNLAEFIRNQFKEDKVIKKYYAVTARNPQPKQGVWKERLLTTHVAGKLRTKVDPRGYPSITHYTQVKSFPKQNASLLKLEPKTGRTHQLRVHCAAHHVPIIGDKTYGDFERNRFFEKQLKEKRLFLHAFSIMLTLPNGEPFYVEAPLPKAFDLSVL